MFYDFLLTTTTGESGGSNSLYTMVTLAIMFGVMFVAIILPQRKQEKKEQAMRNSIEVGDGVTTIGGIVGRVVSIKDDTILIETGSDRVKLRMMKSSIASVEKLDMGAPAKENKESK